MISVLVYECHWSWTRKISTGLDFQYMQEWLLNNNLIIPQYDNGGIVWAEREEQSNLDKSIINFSKQAAKVLLDVLPRSSSNEAPKRLDRSPFRKGDFPLLCLDIYRTTCLTILISNCNFNRNRYSSRCSYQRIRMKDLYRYMSAPCTHKLGWTEVLSILRFTAANDWNCRYQNKETTSLSPFKANYK